MLNINLKKILPSIIILQTSSSMANRAKIFPNSVNSPFSSIACISNLRYFYLNKNTNLSRLRINLASVTASIDSC